MPALIHGNYLAEGSFGLYLHQHLSAVTAIAPFITAWVTAPAESAYLRFDWGDEAPIRPPCITVQHFEPGDLYPGISRQRVVSPTGGKGQVVRHVSEVSCWISRYSGASAGQENPSWQGQLRQLRDMVSYVLNSGDRRIPMVDLTLGLAAPYTTAGLLTIQELRGVEAPPDPNPGLQRRRLLCVWSHVEST